MSPRTASGLVKFRPLRPGGRVALVAPASSFSRAQFGTGVAELQRLGFEPVWDDALFDRQAFTAGKPQVRAKALLDAFIDPQVDAIIAVRGGYGSVEVLPLLDPERLRQSRTAFVGYSDVTTVHSYLSALGRTSVHGVMVEGRLAKGATAYDPVTFLTSLSTQPLGELSPEGLESLSTGSSSDAAGPIVGGTLTQLLASFGTPFEFRPPDGHVLFLDEINERPYKLHRMLMQLRLSGRLEKSRAIIFGQLPGCDELGGKVTARDAIRDVLSDYRGPVLFGFPSGHSTTALVSFPLGVQTRVVNAIRPALIFEEAAAAD